VWIPHLLGESRAPRGDRLSPVRSPALRRETLAGHKIRMGPRARCEAGAGLAVRGDVIIITIIIITTIIIIILREEPAQSRTRGVLEPDCIWKQNREGANPQGPAGPPRDLAVRGRGSAERGGTRRFRAGCSHPSDLLDAARAAKLFYRSDKWP